MSSSGSLGSVSSSPLSPYIGCRLAKHHALPFSLSESLSSAPFNLVHSNIWDPVPFPSLGGFSYYVCFVDDFSRYTWLYFMRSHFDILSIYRQFTEMIHTQFGRRIKVFRSDGAREYLSTAFRALLSSHGTLPQQSCPHTPAQNGVAERKHRHILETLVHSSLLQFLGIYELKLS